jgi:hypothetical protein
MYATQLCDAEVIDSMPPRVEAVGVGRFAAGSVPVTPVASGIDGRSPATNEHGANDVADPHVPMTRWEVCPLAAPSVRVEPEIVQVSQFAPAAVQEVAPGAGGGKTLLCARPSWANEPNRMAYNGNHATRLETCLSGFFMLCCSLFSAAPAGGAVIRYRPTPIAAGPDLKGVCPGGNVV